MDNLKPGRYTEGELLNMLEPFIHETDFKKLSKNEHYLVQVIRRLDGKGSKTCIKPMKAILSNEMGGFVEIRRSVFAVLSSCGNKDIEMFLSDLFSDSETMQEMSIYCLNRVVAENQGDKFLLNRVISSYRKYYQDNQNRSPELIEILLSDIEHLPDARNIIVSGRQL